MHAALTTFLALLASSTSSAQTAAAQPTGARAAVGAIPFHWRLADVDGDGRLDRLVQEDAGVVIGLGTHARGFEPTSQILSVQGAVSVLVADLNADGALDLYFPSKGPNRAFLGDGSGSFVEATAQLGLSDARPAVAAEFGLVDEDELPDLLVHNEREDVLFYGLPGGGFERAQEPPVDGTSAPAALLGAATGSSADAVSNSNAAGGISAGRALPGTNSRHPLRRRHPLAANAGASSSTPPTTLAVTSLAVSGVTQEQRKILNHMSLVQLDDGNGNPLETIRITGANLQLVNGLGATNGAPTDPSSIAFGVVQTNGLGNLILGYNESPGPTSPRTGSHNLVLGRHNSYTSFAGLLAGADNAVDQPFATIPGGQNNSALSPYSSVSGGRFNTAQGFHASVTGGFYNRATTAYSSVSGGFSNRAGDYGTRGLAASITGGSFGTSYGAYSTTELSPSQTSPQPVVAGRFFPAHRSRSGRSSSSGGSSSSSGGGTCIAPRSASSRLSGAMLRGRRRSSGSCSGSSTFFRRFFAISTLRRLARCSGRLGRPR